MTAKKLYPPGEYIFQIYGKSYHSVHCSKSRVLTKVIDTILDIDSFEQKCVILKELLK